uniref:Vacuolar protein sorting-associated protein 8 central domain-containing protein n=2 Tax=Aegilops tauschii subsp. strangulata TaxID=200361 RepID=A0A453SZ73_AEGTS
MLAVLNLRGQLCLFSKDGSELRRTIFILDGLVFDDSILYHTHFSNRFGNPERHFNNSVAVRGATVYILGPSFLTVSRLLPWKEWIEALKRAGDWMGAMDMAMKLYDGHTQGVVDLPRTLDSIREAIMPYLVELLLSYIGYVSEYISIALSNHTGKGGAADGLIDADRSLLTEREEQYARVGGVAVEFCVHIGRNDILFDTVFSKFVAAQSGGRLVLINSYKNYNLSITLILFCSCLKLTQSSFPCLKQLSLDHSLLHPVFLLNFSLQECKGRQFSSFRSKLQAFCKSLLVVALMGSSCVARHFSPSFCCFDSI